MKRRTFLKGCATTIATTGLPYVMTQQKSETNSVVIGEGAFRYECEHNWGERPTGFKFGNASHGVTIDQDGMIYVTHQGGPGSILVLDPDGKFVKQLGHQFQGSGHGIDIRKEGNAEFLYLSPANTKDGFAKIDLKGELVWQKDLDEKPHV